MPAGFRRVSGLAAVLLCAASALGGVPAVQADEPAIAVVVAAARSDAVSPAELVQIFKRRKQFWADGTRIQPVNLPADHGLRQRFSRSVLKLSPEALEEFWNEQYFHGVLPPHVLASEAAVLRFVAGTEAAVGYLSACSADASVRVVLGITADGRIVKPDALPPCD